FMDNDELQFGFKKGVGCRNAIFALRQVTDYFTERGSNAFIASLDASKAFDRINHYTLYTTLINRSFPACFVNLIANWYSKLSIVVRWNGHDSLPLSVLSGVRQGGVLSPALFNIYVNQIIVSIKLLGCGCRMRNTFLGCIMYADDLLLISASIGDLQKMLDVCGAVGLDIGIAFNPKKSMCMHIGPLKALHIAPMSISGAPMQWVKNIKYLG